MFGLMVLLLMLGCILFLVIWKGFRLLLMVKCCLLVVFMSLLVFRFWVWCRVVLKLRFWVL